MFIGRGTLDEADANLDTKKESLKAGPRYRCHTIFTQAHVLDVAKKREQTRKQEKESFHVCEAGDDGLVWDNTGCSSVCVCLSVGQPKLFLSGSQLSRRGGYSRMHFFFFFFSVFSGVLLLIWRTRSKKI